MRQLCVAIALFAGCIPTDQPGEDATKRPLADSWEDSGAPLADSQGCSLIPPPLIHVVSLSYRYQSIATLAETSIVKLTEAEAARLMGGGGQIAASSATGLVASFLDEMRARKRRARVERRDSWSIADEGELAALSARYAAAEFRPFKPYLVRAVAKHEGTGAFSADMCGRSLHIQHGSLGRTTPPSTRVPLVIFLSQQPTQVFATWSIAE